MKKPNKNIVDLIGNRVKINIKYPYTYCRDLFNAIQGEEGVIIQNPSEFSCYDNAYLVKFGESALNKYKETHSGQWQGDNRMEWWTERVNFEILN